MKMHVKGASCFFALRPLADGDRVLVCRPGELPDKLLDTASLV